MMRCLRMEHLLLMLSLVVGTTNVNADSCGKSGDTDESALMQKELRLDQVQPAEKVPIALHNTGSEVQMETEMEEPPISLQGSISESSMETEEPPISLHKSGSGVTMEGKATAGAATSLKSQLFDVCRQVEEQPTCGMMVGVYSHLYAQTIKNKVKSDDGLVFDLPKLSKIQDVNVMILQYPGDKKGACCDMYSVLASQHGTKFVDFDIPDTPKTPAAMKAKPAKAKVHSPLQTKKHQTCDAEKGGACGIMLGITKGRRKDVVDGSQRSWGSSGELEPDQINDMPFLSEVKNMDMITLWFKKDRRTACCKVWDSLKIHPLVVYKEMQDIGYGKPPEGNTQGSALKKLEALVNSKKTRDKLGDDLTDALQNVWTGENKPESVHEAFHAAQHQVINHVFDQAVKKKDEKSSASGLCHLSLVVLAVAHMMRMS